MKKVLMIILITLTTSSFAQNITKLNEGDAAPFTGALVSAESFNQMRKSDEQAKLDRRENIVLKDLRMTDQELINFHKADAKRQREALSKAEFQSTLYKFGYFIAGVFITSLAFKYVREVERM